MTAPSQSAVAIIGSTGLVGSHILSNLLTLDTYQPIHTITRRAPKPTSASLNAVIDTDTTKWAPALSGLSPLPSAVFSALGTTRAAAGGINNQWKIDHDLNIELAKAAKAAGVKTFVFVSSAGTRGALAGLSPYVKMKNGVEDTVKELDFDQAIIIKPAVILGNREQSRLVESIAQSAVRSLSYLAMGLQDKLGQEAEVIARAAIRAVQIAEEGKAPGKYWLVEPADIVKLGRTEWQGKHADKVEKL
ncbi:Protein fmp52, mitochondrial [Conoideocrella luteorostrata]|uniref:Protein fmp52, mitochondrial n=1 Tax=Conoideocrella luteorostrata TaxID=1105319 RepID=A0AAJ0CAC2_9HYPO|nr:Protein fmp52, mitochondrial [Conoideocrella luteorostrata]